MKGFKSFADKVVISFDQKITGIVGPNGCGKSNITDAIRWVLGEQSAKSLRGSTMSDVIFSGSDQRKTVNLAEVTLVFDNSGKHLNAAYEEIEITRRIHRSGEGEYLLNRVPVRLKDIQELILDSGLGRDSLSMISQGNISAFAEARPQDRRGLFEEAAGVAKYKKRKLESLSKLNRTQENLSRAQDILYELEKQVNPLKRAAKKAEIYREKKERLQTIEQAVLIDEIDTIKAQLDHNAKSIFELESKIAMQQTSINVSELANDENKKEQRQIDQDINVLQDNILNLVNEIQILEKRRAEIEEKRKYAMEMGNEKEKAIELKSLLDEAKFEYDDRTQRLQTLKADIALANQSFQSLTMKIIDQEQECNEALSLKRRLSNRQEVLENLLKQPFMQQAGVKAIVEAQSSLPGVLGVVAQSLTPESGYEEAITVALGGALYNVVTEDEASARGAINFLKKNESGRATFLPKNVLRPRYVNRENQIICENTEGYLGVASDFLTCEAAFTVVFESLLGNVLVCDNLIHGNHLAELLKYQFKIVTLDGDVIHRGGSMTGGKQRHGNSPLTIQKELSEVIEALQKQDYLVDSLTNVLNDSRRQRADLEAQIMEKRISAAKLEPIVDAKRAKYEKLLSDYETIAETLNLNTSDNNPTFADDLIINLTQAYSKRDDMTATIKTKRERRMVLMKEIERRDVQHRQMRQELTKLESALRDIQVDNARLETRLDNNITILNTEYQSTYEYAKEHIDFEVTADAKEEVVRLRQEIADLGNVNMNAPEEFAEINERYEALKHQYDDLVHSKNQLLDAIDEMDEVMVVQFKEMFDKINGELQTTFSKLFGGGKARLIMENPDDILNTGIDIDVQPPGKTVQNIRLFSGGEKALIAIAVLFSILKARPVPLCIFDEVEAALDQANVERFANYIKEFSDDTQFIVVTHRPGTMEQCDVLYGVTMPIQGVSQMLKVKLVEATEYALEGKS